MNKFLHLSREEALGLAPKRNERIFDFDKAVQVKIALTSPTALPSLLKPIHISYRHHVILPQLSK